MTNPPGRSPTADAFRNAADDLQNDTGRRLMYPAHEWRWLMYCSERRAAYAKRKAQNQKADADE